MGGGVLYSVVVLQVWILVKISARDFSRTSPCSTTSCVRASSELLNYIDADVNPCDDFYEFSCSKFLSNIYLQKEPIVNVETIMRDNYLARIRVIIQEPILHNDSPSMIMAKQLYSACINEQSKDNSVQFIKDTLKSVGGWAVLEEDWNDENFDWITATYKLRQLGFPYEYFVQMVVRDDQDDVSEYVLQLGSPLSVIKMKTEQLDEFLYNHMVDLAIAFGANATTAENDYKEVIAFLKNLLAIENSSWDDDITRDYFTLADVQKKFPDVPWIEYVKEIMSPIPSIELDTIVQVTEIPYIFHLGSILNKTSNRILSNYMAWRMIIEHSSVLTNNIVEMSQNFFKNLNKQIVLQMPSMTKACSGIVESTFSLPIQAEYVNRFVSKEAKKDVVDMIENIIEEFKDEIDDLDWMDYESRRYAINRISNISIYVAYPDEMLDAKKVNQLYEGYKMYEDNLLASLLSVSYHKVNSNFRKLHEPEHKEENYEINKKYTTYGIVYYLSSDNSITVPHRILQHIIYNEDRPKYLNYGGLGTFIAHQIFHAIFEGSSIRQETEYYKWLSPETQDVYQNKLSCVAEQYQNFFVPEINRHVNSSITKNEDIADVAGIQLAYKAYKKWIHTYGKESRLPRLDYTPKQMFWISSAIRYCSKGSHEAIDKAVTYSYQSLKKFRVLGALKNSKEFAKDFHCPLGSIMNPQDKCEFW